MKTKRTWLTPLVAGLLPLGFAFTACDDDDPFPKVAVTRADAGPDTAGPIVIADAAPAGDDATAGSDVDGGIDLAAAGDTPVAARPLYAIANEIYTDTDSTTYVSVLTSLDFKELDLTKAHEYGGGRATIATANGWLFVAAPESPVITRFAVGDDGTLTENGKISFANLGIKSVGLDDWSVTFLTPTKAYLMNFEEGNTLVWNPTTMEISGEIAPPAIANVPMANLDGSPAVVSGNRLYRVFYRVDWKAYVFSQDQYLAVYDTDTDKLIDLVKETRCPALNNRMSKDEQGNVYFNNWIWNVSATLVKGAPKSCALRLAPGASRLDPAWTLPYAGLTGGREAANFNYIGNGKALLSVFHNERVTVDPTTDPSDLAGTPNWRLWGVDLDQQTAAPFEDIPWNTGATSIFQLDGRVFAFVPGKDWALTQGYEIKDGKPTLAFELKGWSYSFLKVR